MLFKQAMGVAAKHNLIIFSNSFLTKLPKLLKISSNNDTFSRFPFQLQKCFTTLFLDVAIRSQFVCSFNHLNIFNFCRLFNNLGHFHYDLILP